MGYWASYIVKDRERTRLFVDRWGARNYCCHWLFWGPDLLEPMLRGLEPDFEGGVPDWAEGGMTVDLQAKRLTWFCEDPVYDCLSTIEVLLPLQRALWPGWEVNWAARGLDDLLSLAGLPSKPVDYQAYEARRSGLMETTPGGTVLDVAGLYEQTFVHALLEPEGEPFGVASLLEPDGRRKLLPLRDGEIEELFEFGPIRLLGGLGARVSHPSVVLPAQSQSTQGGFDIDPMTRTLRYWSSDSVWSGYFPKVWEGWTLVDWRLDYRAHEKLLEGRLRVELNFTTETLETLQEYLVPGSEQYEPYDIECPDDDECQKADFPLDLQERRRRWSKALATAFPEHKIGEI